MKRLLPEVVASELKARDVQTALRDAADVKRAARMMTFFQTGPGQYGEGDQFLGISVPDQRRIARRFQALSLAELVLLLYSPAHEDRFTALEILVLKYERGDVTQQERVFRCYLQHTGQINNWDLVDTSARYIVGEHLRHRSRKRLYRLARSTNMWDRRIAMVATHAWVADNDTADLYNIAEQLLDDPHHLIHKAVGWMLREAGRQSRPMLMTFLARHYSRIPRTTLRYAIEHMSPNQRRRILNGDFGAK